MIYYRGSFADIEDTVYVVDILVKNLTDSGVIHELIFDNDTPVKINTKSDGLFGAIKSRGCTISLLTTELLMNIWSATSQGVEVNIYNTNGWPVNMSTADIPATYTNIFHGFLTPCAYTQGYSENIEKLEIEAVEAISTLKDIDYTNYNGTNYQIITFKDILRKLLYNICGYSGKLYFPRSFKSIDNSSLNIYSGNVIIDEISISESNFYDDDEKHTPWKCYDVIEEMMKFLNCSLIPNGNDIWIVDYNYINAKNAVFGQQGNNTQYYKYWNLEDNSTDTYSTSSFGKVINGSSYAEGGQTITLDDVYNKISLSNNTYPIEEIIPNYDEAKNLINTNLELGLTEPNISIWNRTVTSGALWWKTSKTFPIATDYQVFNRLEEVGTGWKQHWYNHSSLIERGGERPYYNSSSSSIYTDDTTNKYYNTMGALIQNYAFIKNSSSIPAKLDWKTYITLFALDDTSSTSKSGFEELANKPVIEYTSPDSIVYSAKNGKSYITFNAKLWFQKTKAGTVTIVNTNAGHRIYKTNPVEDVIDEGDPFELPNPRRITTTNYNSGMPGGGSQTGGQNPYAGSVTFNFRHHRVPEQMGYGTGFKILKLKLQIGDKYWDGTDWTTTESTFFVNYNNNPQPKENEDETIGYDDEYLNCLEWMTPVYNTTYTDGIGKDCVAIPLNYDSNNNPINIGGQLKLTIYMPWQWDNYTIDTPEYQTYTGDEEGFYGQTFDNYCPCIYMKDLELNYVYVDDSPWWLTSDDDKSDIEYSNIISNENVIDGDDIELKINSWYNNKPISKSYVISSDKYVDKIWHMVNASEQKQEENIINNYYNHYSQPKIIYNCKTKEYYYPYNKFAIRCLTSNINHENPSDDSWTNSDFKYMLDTQEWDVKNKTNQIQLIQY